MMLTWLTENFGTIVVTCALIALVIKIILYLRNEKKCGRSSCGGNCSQCGLCQSLCEYRRDNPRSSKNQHIPPHHDHISS